MQVLICTFCSRGFFCSSCATCLVVNMTMDLIWSFRLLNSSFSLELRWSFINLASHLHCMNECISHSIFSLQCLCLWHLLQDISTWKWLSIYRIRTAWIIVHFLMFILVVFDYRLENIKVHTRFVMCFHLFKLLPCCPLLYFILSLLNASIFSVLSI